MIRRLLYLLVAGKHLVARDDHHDDDASEDDSDYRYEDQNYIYR